MAEGVLELFESGERMVVVSSRACLMLGSLEALGDEFAHVGFDWLAICNDFWFGGFV